jgi:hypothetical protein
LWGYQVPLDAETLKRLYPDRASYLSKVKAATRKSLRERWITERDAEKIIGEAEDIRLPQIWSAAAR